MSESASAVDDVPMIRDLREDELAWVASQERAIFGASAWSHDLIEGEFHYGSTRWRAVERGGELIGYAVYGFEGDAFHLMNLAVVADARRTGTGRAVMRDLVAQARELAAPEVWLEVAVTNAAAIALYREFGFEDVRVRRRYYQPEDVDALVMRARLV